jgi:hypothetical protein
MRRAYGAKVTRLTPGELSSTVMETVQCGGKWRQQSAEAVVAVSARR